MKEYGTTNMDKEKSQFIDFSKSPEEIIKSLKEKSVSVPTWEKLKKEYEPKEHSIIVDKTSRKDKTRSDGSIEKASRISIPLEKLLVTRMTEFMFSIPVERVYKNIEDNDIRKEIAKAIEAIYTKAKINTENIERGRNFFAACEICTIWYSVQKPNHDYGFDSNFKLKCKTYSPKDGVSLYPSFDEYDDMLAMSFEYKKKKGKKEITCFETYTDLLHLKWEFEDGVWSEIAREPISIKKIPAIYEYRKEAIYEAVSYLRQEIEYSLSRNSDVISYNSAPVLKISGGVTGEEEKGETRRIFRVESGGDVSYVSWSQSIEALKFHVDTCRNLFWSMSQMPDISFANMMALGSIGYDARQTLLTDAHLKVGDESGAWIKFFEREASVIKAYLKEMKKEWATEIDNVEIEHVITPFIQNDEDATIDRALKGNGGKPIFSHRESIAMVGNTSDPDKTLQEIKDEELEASQRQMENIFNAGGM